MNDALLQNQTKALLLPDELFVKSFFTKIDFLTLSILRNLGVADQTYARNVNAAVHTGLASRSDATNPAIFRSCAVFPLMFQRQRIRDFEN